MTNQQRKKRHKELLIKNPAYKQQGFESEAMVIRFTRLSLTLLRLPAGAQVQVQTKYPVWL